MFLSDRHLQQVLPKICNDYVKEGIGPASLDVRLDGKFLVPEFNSYLPPSAYTYDLKEPKPPFRWRPVEQNYIILQPGEFILASTIEYFRFDNGLSGDIRGKSTIGRSGLGVELAGFIDPGFVGNLTLEIVNHLPCQYKLYAGQFIAQVRFFFVDDVDVSYMSRGTYQDQRGPTPPNGYKLYVGEKK